MTPANCTTNAFLAFLFLLSFLFSGCSGEKKGDKKDGPPANPPITIAGMVVKPDVLNEGLEVTGAILPMEETVLTPEVSGRVVSLHLPEGQTVKEGTLLVKIFDGDLQAQLKKLETQLKIAESVESRQRELLKIDGVSRQDYDLSVLQVSNLKAEMDLVRVSIAKTELRAPFDGKIGLKNISLGAVISPATAVATIRADRQLKLDFSVPEKYGALMNAGRRVLFEVEGINGDLTANILATEQSIDPNNRNLKVRALVTSPNAKLSPGQFAKVKFNFKENNQALLIPTQAVIPQAREKKVAVSRNGKAEFVTVKTGARQATTVEIVEGLQVGDTIVTKGVLFVRPGSVLKFSSVN